MKVIVWIGAADHHQKWCGAFVDGLRRHGITPQIAVDRADHECDLAVFWGHKRRRVIEAQRAAGRDYLVLEHGFIGDRSKWTSAGFNGLNGRADFHLHKRQDRSRFELNFGHLMKPWNAGGDYALLLGQVPGDASVRDVNLDEWYRDTIKAIRKVCDAPIMFRPHPKAGNAPRPDAEMYAGGRTLAECLSMAAFAVTFNSNSGVDAALAGVPVYALDAGSMASPVANDNLCLAPWRPDRMQWAVDLSWCQWTQAEIRDGIAWDYLTTS